MSWLIEGVVTILVGSLAGKYLPRLWKKIREEISKKQSVRRFNGAADENKARMQKVLDLNEVIKNAEAEREKEITILHERGVTVAEIVRGTALGRAKVKRILGIDGGPRAADG